jgi:hypothetical protein
VTQLTFQRARTEQKKRRLAVAVGEAPRSLAMQPQPHSCPVAKRTEPDLLLRVAIPIVATATVCRAPITQLCQES